MVRVQGASFEDAVVVVEALSVLYHREPAKVGWSRESLSDPDFQLLLATIGDE